MAAAAATTMAAAAVTKPRSSWPGILLSLARSRPAMSLFTFQCLLRSEKDLISGAELMKFFADLGEELAVV